MQTITPTQEAKFKGIAISIVNQLRSKILDGKDSDNIKAAIYKKLDENEKKFLEQIYSLTMIIYFKKDSKEWKFK